MIKKFRQSFAILAAGVLLLASCATMQAGRDRGAVDRVASRINGRDAAGLAAMSRTPFLLDGEIVLLPADMASFWQEALRAGFTVREPRLQEGLPLSAESWRRFGGAMEVRAFFGRYLPKGTRLLEMRTADGRTLLLLVKRTLFSTRLHGLKGPY